MNERGRRDGIVEKSSGIGLAVRRGWQPADSLFHQALVYSLLGIFLELGSRIAPQIQMQCTASGGMKEVRKRAWQAQEPGEDVLE